MCRRASEFDRWIQEQSQPAQVSGAISEGQKIFERTACINCHTVAGTAANGRFGPDLTHLMSRDTIASGAATNTPANLRRWIQDPNIFKPGCKMPAMGLSDPELDAVTAISGDPSLMSTRIHFTCLQSEAHAPAGGATSRMGDDRRSQTPRPSVHLLCAGVSCDRGS